MTDRPRVLLLVGYFDWFSGYQETALARWLPLYADTDVLASDRVNPIFTDEHLARLGINRLYAQTRSVEHGVRVTRMPVHEIRSMVWTNRAVKFVREGHFDLVIQVMPGQGLPIAGSLAGQVAKRVVLYGDNAAMWSHLKRGSRILKGAAFAASKGVAYVLTNARADLLYGYTPDTLHRLRAFTAGKSMSVLPLSFDPQRFFFDPVLRGEIRAEHGYEDEEIVLVSAGKFQAKKRLDAVVEAFLLLAPHDPRLRLHLVGADCGSEARALQDRLRSAPAFADRVTISGFVEGERLNSLFNASDIGVWPTMPAVTIQQAMGTGLPVVLPRNNWVGHLLREGSGAYLPPGRPLREGLCEAISRVVGSIHLTRRAARARTNAWLGADRVSCSLLRDAGFSVRELPDIAVHPSPGEAGA